MRLASTRSAPPTNHPLTKPRSKLYVVMRLSLQGATSGAAWPWSFRYTVHGATTLVFQSPPRGFPVHWLHHMRSWRPGPFMNPVTWLRKTCIAGSMFSCVASSCLCLTVRFQFLVGWKDYSTSTPLERLSTVVSWSPKFEPPPRLRPFVSGLGGV